LRSSSSAPHKTSADPRGSAQYVNPGIHTFRQQRAGALTRKPSRKERVVWYAAISRFANRRQESRPLRAAYDKEKLTMRTKSLAGVLIALLMMAELRPRRHKK